MWVGISSLFPDCFEYVSKHSKTSEFKCPCTSSFSRSLKIDLKLVVAIAVSVVMVATMTTNSRIEKPAVCAGLIILLKDFFLCDELRGIENEEPRILV